MEFLKVELADLKEKLIEVEKERDILLSRQFSLDKIKDDDSAVLFYTGFPNYGALISFYNSIEPNLKKMQYWKGEKLLKESQPYQVEDNRKKPGPSRKLSYLDEFLLVLMRLKAGLFVQDLADRFGISSSLVSRICIAWINLLYVGLKDLLHSRKTLLFDKNDPWVKRGDSPMFDVAMGCYDGAEVLRASWPVHTAQIVIEIPGRGHRPVQRRRFSNIQEHERKSRRQSKKGLFQGNRRSWIENYSAKQPQGGGLPGCHA